MHVLEQHKIVLDSVLEHIISNQGFAFHQLKDLKGYGKIGFKVIAISFTIFPRVKQSRGLQSKQWGSYIFPYTDGFPCGLRTGKKESAESGGSLNKTRLNHFLSEK